MVAMWRSEAERVEILLGGFRAKPQGNSSIRDEVSLEANSFLIACAQAGVTQHGQRRIILRASVISALGVLVAALCLSVLPLVGLVLYLLGEWYVLAQKINRRAHSFERDYTALLLSLASAIRTGLDPLAALLGMIELFSPPSEMRKELDLLKLAIDAGATEEQAIRGFAVSIRHPDLPLFRTAFILARREGSSLGECLQRLARVTRQRQSFRRKISSAIAMQKLSAIGIGLSAVAIGIVQALSNPKALALALEHPVGSRLLAVGVFLIMSGMAWMVGMASSRV